MTPWEQYLQSLYLERASGMPRWHLTPGDRPEGLRAPAAASRPLDVDDSELTTARRRNALDKAINDRGDERRATRKAS